GHPAGERLSHRTGLPPGAAGETIGRSRAPVLAAPTKELALMRFRPLPLMGVALLVAAGIALTACGSSSSSSTTSATTTPAAAATNTSTSGESTGTSKGAAA